MKKKLFEIFLHTAGPVEDIIFCIILLFTSYAWSQETRIRLSGFSLASKLPEAVTIFLIAATAVVWIFLAVKNGLRRKLSFGIFTVISLVIPLIADTSGGDNIVIIESDFENILYSVRVIITSVTFDASRAYLPWLMPAVLSLSAAAFAACYITAEINYRKNKLSPQKEVIK